MNDESSEARKSAARAHARGSPPQASRSADVIGRRAPRTAGSRSPITPMIVAKTIAVRTMASVIRKAKAISLKLWVP